MIIRFSYRKSPLKVNNLRHVRRKLASLKVFPLIFLICFLVIAQAAHARRLYYAEEFYLYVMNLHYTSAPLERNIRFMQWALKAPFDNPVRSLALITTEDEFKRYKALFRMHVNLLIIDSYLQLARRFDKEHVYFFNLWYAKRLKKSFTIAEYYYKIGLNYWEESKKFAEEGSGIPVRINIDEWEDELYLVQTNELDYESIIQSRLEKLESRINTVDSYLAKLEKDDGD